jgi:hypothetical protein
MVLQLAVPNIGQLTEIQDIQHRSTAYRHR